MKILRHLLLYTFVCLMAASCNPMQGRKAILVDDDGQSMRFERNRQESRNEKWDARKKKNFKKNRYKSRD